MHEVSFTQWEIAMTQLLIILALFFTMRSCEYLQTKYLEESERTKILRVKNIVFKKAAGGILDHSEPFEVLALAQHMIIITFEFQKNDWRDHTLHEYVQHERRTTLSSQSRSKDHQENLSNNTRSLRRHQDLYYG